jgi:hypothetical protein
LLEPQERMSRRLVEELKDFDNVYYEICNEPYFGGVTLEWQHQIAEVIRDAQKDHPHPKLLSRNVANGSAKISDPHSAVSVFNFHYAAPPDAVAVNDHLNKPIGDNETGFRGTGDAPYRMEAWDFIIAGGALFNHLDYSFAAGYEDGTFEYPSTQPGGGNHGLRRQFGILGGFIRSFDFIKMRPDNGVIAGGVPAGGTARALVERGRAYAIYLRRESARQAGDTELKITLPAGSYDAAWIDTKTGGVAKEESVRHSGGVHAFTAPAYDQDIALRIRRSEGRD